MGAFNIDRKSPRPIIAKYLNYSDKTFILQKFRQSRSLQIDGMRVFIFADYFIEVSKKKEGFPTCMHGTLSTPGKIHLGFSRHPPPHGPPMVTASPSKIFQDIFSADSSSDMSTIKTLFNKVRKCLGLPNNYGKSEILPIGTLYNLPWALHSPFMVAKSHITYLGIKIGKLPSSIYHLNYPPVKKKLKVWETGWICPFCSWEDVT